MSTRALYSFVDGNEAYHVYKHHDGYPSGGLNSICAAMGRAWSLPRFEPDEFAAAFVAANKKSPGDVRLTQGAAWEDAASSDIEYHYTITAPNGVLAVKVDAVSEDGGKWAVNTLMKGKYSVVAAWATHQDA